MAELPEIALTAKSEREDLGLALRIILYMLLGAVFFLTSLVALFYMFFLPQAPALSAYEFTNGDFATVYYDPIPAFGISERNVVITDVTPGVLQIEIEDDIIYMFGYISNDGINWKRIILQPGPGATLDSDKTWISSSAGYDHVLSAGEFNVTGYPYTSVGYVTLYSCSRDTIGRWDCHDGWQIRKFTTVIVKELDG
jgi:hypothetical protein